MKLFALFATYAAAQDIAEDDVCYSNGVEAPCNPVLARSGRNSGGGDRSISGGGDRRYQDLKAIAAKLWKLNGMTGKNKFDERKYWAYGCHCYLLGDRPLSEMGSGAPKVRKERMKSSSMILNLYSCFIINVQDGLDNKCKAFKDCQKCVRDKHGDQCIGEMKKYTWKYAGKRGVFESTNMEGSCERELFQCDLKFAKETLASVDTFNEDYHAFWSTRPNGFDNRDPDNCPSNGGIPVEHQCCGGYDRE